MQTNTENEKLYENYFLEINKKLDRLNQQLLLIELQLRDKSQLFQPSQKINASAKSKSKQQQMTKSEMRKLIEAKFNKKYPGWKSQKF
jgi:hypothetical protein